MSDPTPDAQAATPAPLSPRFVYTVGLLLGVIIAALTGLALQYRQRMIAAETQLQQSREEQRRQSAVLDTFLKLEPGEKVRIITERESEPPPPTADGE